MQIVPTSKIFWWSRQPVETLRVRFLGWKSEEARLAAGGLGSLHTLTDELSAGRRSPGFPVGIVDIHGRADETEETGIPVGSDIDVLFYPDKITPDGIAAYLGAIDLIVE